MLHRKHTPVILHGGFFCNILQQASFSLVLFWKDTVMSSVQQELNNFRSCSTAATSENNYPIGVEYVNELLNTTCPQHERPETAHTPLVWWFQRYKFRTFSLPSHSNTFCQTFVLSVYSTGNNGLAKCDSKTEISNLNLINQLMISANNYEFSPIIRSLFPGLLLKSVLEGQLTSIVNIRLYFWFIDIDWWLCLENVICQCSS